MVNAVTTYNTLVSAAIEAFEDDGTEFASFLPVAIDNAEQRLTRELDTYGVVQSSVITVSASSPTFTKPSGTRFTKTVIYKDPTTSRNTVLRRKTDDYLREYWPQDTSVGTPVYYAEDNQTTYRIAPCCSANTSVTVVYAARPTALTSANQTNFFTQFTPDALFYATMMEMSLWARNQRLFEAYQALYVAARDSINIEGKRQRRDDGTPIGDPRGENTLEVSRQG